MPIFCSLCVQSQHLDKVEVRQSNGHGAILAPSGQHSCICGQGGMDVSSGCCKYSSLHRYEYKIMHVYMCAAHPYASLCGHIHVYVGKVVVSSTLCRAMGRKVLAGAPLTAPRGQGKLYRIHGPVRQSLAARCTPGLTGG